MMLKILLAISLLIDLSTQDIYLHNPRGSNNRLNEASATRNNNNRVFDSQNNARGGYNIGDATSKASTNEQGQYIMKYFQSGSSGQSKLLVEWTNQHGCGGNPSTDSTKVNCELVLQYMCQPKSDYDANNLDRIRDGLTTNTQPYTEMVDVNEDAAAFAKRKQQDVKSNLVLQETWQSYDACFKRERNGGLFTADQGLKRNRYGYSGAVTTRQNPNGNRNGYECPEERDYYPYWHPSSWKDIAILTSHVSLCDYYRRESFNVKPKNLCVEKYANNAPKSWSRWNNKTGCEANRGLWIEVYNYLEKATNIKNEQQCNQQSIGNLIYKWALPYDFKQVDQKECLVLLSAPICKQADWTRSNHLGNTRDSINPPNFEWILPYFPSKKVQTCVFRIRYNISTDDFDPFKTDSKFNGKNSPIKKNPHVDIGLNNQVLELAINTDQYGRVFQDRSHSFLLLPRPSNIGDDVNVYNLNVRGKRGNIVQVYPAVEYDFIPNNLIISTRDLLHIQWTGSNTHNNQGNGGDGQTGNDGQGKDGTDRSNLVETKDLNENYPLPFEMTNMWKDMELVGFLNNNINFTDDTRNYLSVSRAFTSQDLALYFSSGSYYTCVKSTTCGNASYETLNANNNQLDADLNNAPASLSGAIVRFTKNNKLYVYMCSRNNNFSNRSQKGSITVR